MTLNHSAKSTPAKLLKLIIPAIVAVSLALPVAAAPKHGANKFAVLIGIDNYAGTNGDLHGSVGDVADIHEVLRANGWQDSNIRILTNEQATLSNIRNTMKWLISKTDDNSFSIFHYSGHVKQIGGDRDNDGEDLDEYLWPIDNGYLSDAELGVNMRQLRGWSWVDISGCESAGMNDNIAAPNRLFTAASQENEKAYDHAGWKNSIFTGLLIDYGMRQNQADSNDDGVITIHEAFRYAAVHAPEITKRQSNGPQHPYLAGGDGVEWRLNPPPPLKDPEPWPLNTIPPN